MSSSFPSVTSDFCEGGVRPRRLHFTRATRYDQRIGVRSTIDRAGQTQAQAMLTLAKDPSADVAVLQAVQRVLSASFPRGRVERVMLVKPPDGGANVFDVSTARRGRYANYPPYGLFVLAAHLREIGIHVEVLNLNHEVLRAATEWRDEDGPFDMEATWRSHFDHAAAAFMPDLVGVTCMFTMTHPSFKSVCQHAKNGGHVVAIGGVHTSNDTERVLDDIEAVDFAFTREADTSLPTFCRVVAGELPLTDLAQLVVRDGATRHRLLADARPTVDEMDVMPAFDLSESVGLSRYGVIGLFHAFVPPSTPTATSLSNRGCRARCTFCSVPLFNGRTVRQRPVESVLDELESLRDSGIRHIVWLDDDLLRDSVRALRLFRGMVDRELGLTWDASNGLIAASCDDELVAAMEASGCVAVHLGMETGNPTILRQIRKPGTVEVFLRAAEVFRRHPRIHTRVFLMIGFPNETLAMIEDTLNVALEMDLDWYSVNPLQPLPNTPIYDSMVAQGLISPVDSHLAFMSGGYGAQDKIEETKGASFAGFRNAFSEIDADSLPTPDQIHSIWFYMNYHLNYHRLFRENRPEKIEQMMRHLRTLASRIAPDHALALYFLAYLQLKRDGVAEPEVVDRLGVQLARSTYWKDRFDAFGMSHQDVVSGVFPNEHAPRLVVGGKTSRRVGIRVVS